MFRLWQRGFLKFLLFSLYFGMWKKKDMSAANPAKPGADTFPIIVSKVETPFLRVRAVKSKEKVKFASTNRKRLTNAGEKSGNITKVCVDLMPLLAAAKEPDEEEEEEKEEEENKKEDSSCKSEKEAGTSNRNVLFITKPQEQTSVFNTGFNLNLNSDTKQPLNPRLLLPPLTQPAAAPECLKMRRCKTPLPPISSSEQTSTISADFTVGSCKGDGFVIGEESDSRPWIDNPLLSKSRSAEFRLPDISLSSLDSLLQTVSQKLGRKKRGGDEEPWGRVQSDHHHHLLAVTDQRLRTKRVGHCCTKNNRPTDIETEKEALVDEHSDSQRRLPPLHSTPRPTVILTMTKKNLLTPTILQ